MADITFTSLAAKTDPAVTDEIPIWDLVAGEAKKATITNILNARLTGGGSIATGGFNLTLTGTSTLNGSVVGSMTGGGTVATGGFTLTVGGGSAITGTLSGGGTVATAGFTLTVGGTSTVNGSLVGSMTGGGTVATGGFTLTVPATGTAALLATANAFTNAQTITPTSTTVDPLRLDVPASTTGVTQRWMYNGTTRASMVTQAASTIFTLTAFDNGAGNGPSLAINRNNNGSTPAAGFINLQTQTGAYNVWVDNTGLLRIWNGGAPSNANDTQGTVVGTQSSMAEAKHISDGLATFDEVAERVRAGAAAVKRFAYRSGAFNGQEFEGVVTDLAPHYGMDRDEAHPQGKSLNEIQIMGDLLRAVDWLVGRVKELEGK